MRLPLLAHPSPLPGEVLSSYVIRLASGNSLRPMRLTTLLGITNFWKRDPDVSATVGEIGLIAQAAGIDCGEILACSLRPAIEAIHGTVRQGEPPRFVLTPGKHRGVELARGLPICVACVRETGAVMREWRLTTSVMCERHGVPLIDCCPTCGFQVNHIRPHLAKRGGTVINAPDHCWHCRRRYPLPERLPEVDLDACKYMQRLMREAVEKGEVDWKGLRLSTREFQAILEGVLRQHYPSREVTGAARWRPETAGVHERLTLVMSGGRDMQGGVVQTLRRWRERGVLPHQVCTPSELPATFRNLVEDALARDIRCLAPQLSGRQTFTFTDRQWRVVSPMIPPTPRTSRHGFPPRQILRAWFTRNLRCIRQTSWSGAMVGGVGYLAMSRRITSMARDGTLDRVVGVMIDRLPELLPVLTAPGVVCSLHQLESRHADRLWQQMVEVRVRRWRVETDMRHHGGRATTSGVPGPSGG